MRLSGPAQDDLRTLLAASLERWGEEGRSRYARLVARALRKVADDPHGPRTKDRPELSPGMRSLHLRHARARSGVRAPVHVIYYRRAADDIVEVVRVLHERMDPESHLDDP